MKTPAFRRGTRVVVAVNGEDVSAIVVSTVHPLGYFRGCVLVRFDNGVEQWLAREVIGVWQDDCGLHFCS